MKKYIDITLLTLTLWIVRGLNVWRCKHISRKDNNRLFNYGAEIEAIIKRIKCSYKEETVQDRHSGNSGYYNNR